jgi:hypothetical protein
MAVIAFDSGETTRFPTFALRNLTTWTKVANQPSLWEIKNWNCLNGVDTTFINNGSVSLRCTSAGTTRQSRMRRSIKAATHSDDYVSFIFLAENLPATSCDFFSLTTATEALVVRLNLNSAGDILVYAGTTPTLKATIAAGVVSNTWYHISMHVVAGTPGTLVIRFQDGADVDCSGTDMSPWYYLVIGNLASVTSGWDFQNIQVNDTTGTVNNSWPGNPIIPVPSRPDADTALTDWVRSSGSNDFDMIKEAQPDLDTTYVASTVDADRSTYGMDDISNPPNTAIRAVCLCIVAKRADAASIIPLVSRGGTTIELTPIPIGIDYMTPIEVIIELDPIAASDWTEANFNATQFGFKHQVD